LAAAADGAAAKLASLRPAVAAVECDRQFALIALEDAAAALGASPDVAAAEAALQVANLRAEQSRTALAAARAARDASRAALTDATAALQALQAAASRAESQVAALRPQQARLQAEHAEAAAVHDAAIAAAAALPDLAALGRNAAAAAAAAQGALASLAAAQRAAAQTADRQAAAEAQLAALDRARGEAELGAAGAARMLAAAEAAWARDAAALASCQDEAARLPDAAAMASAASLARLAVSEARGRETAAAEALAARLATKADIAWRLPALEAELAAWQARHEEAARRHEALVGRAAAARDDCAALGQEPVLLAARASDSGDRLAAAAARHLADEAALRAAEDRLRAAALARRDADAGRAACREAVARHEGGAAGAQAGLRSVLERAVERLGPDAELPEIALPPAADPARTGEAEEERARRKLDRLQRERDEMGPVNLRADLELDEVETRIAAIDAEREELATAIAKLRGGIGHLNREGRARLAAVFTQVDAHFRTLFTRMMGGGRAHLALTGSDDPLAAGLEIYAEPPGKKLSALSLLSGGEQALTALSLIFAVFRCTPAPVAVLDEVDAPLDDVNVDRFCGLLEDVVRDTGTRFLVVTHHQLTMSRMDRLFGVTMQERGVSRLLSVDLRRAAEMVEPVMQAAE
jgi:chromosome segregation protein